MDVCLGHILESSKGIEMKFGLYVDVSQGKVSAHEP